MAYASYQKKEYQQSDDVRKAQEALLAHKSTKPGDYASQYQQQIENLYGKITNRPKFSYNVNSVFMCIINYLSRSFYVLFVGKR